MAFFWPCGHEGQTFFDLLAKIQARRIKRSNDWGKTLFFKKNLVLFIVELSVIFFSTLIFSTLNTTLNSTLDTLLMEDPGGYFNEISVIRALKQSQTILLELILKVEVILINDFSQK